MNKLSIIIVNFKGWESLKGCLNSLVSIKETTALDPEVIVVDNFSNDGNLKKFKKLYPDFLFIENEGNYGFSNGNNRGARYATGEYLLFLNPDTIVSKDAIQDMLSLAKNNLSYHIISVQQKRPSGKPENPFGVFPTGWTINGLIKTIYLQLSKKYFKKYCGSQRVIFPDWVSGSVLMIKQEIFKKIGGWDEDFWLYYEDVDLCKRIRENGGTVALLCDVSIIHQHGGLTRKNKKNIAFYKTEVLKSKHIYFHKHFTGISQILLQLFLVINTIFLEKLVPAIFGLIFIPFFRVRVHLFIYFYLWKYYFLALGKKTWIIPSKLITRSH